MSIRILKYLRWFSLGMIMLVTGLVAYFFFFRGVPESNTRNPSTPALPVDITSSTREIEYIESRDGRPLFRVLARRNVATREGINELEHVRAIYYGKEGERQDSIEADRCFYSVTENRVRFEGHVRMRTAQGYTLETSGLGYDKKTETAAGESDFHLTAPGMAGAGRGFRLDMRRRELTVPSRITLHYDLGETEGLDPTTLRERYLDLEAGRALLEEGEHRLRLEDGVRLQTALSLLEGRTAEVLMTAERAVRSAVCRGDARYQRAEKETRIELAGQTIHFLLRAGERTTLEEVRAEETARLRTGDGTLSAGVIRIVTTPEGVVDRVLADGGTRFQTAADGRGIEGDRLSLGFSQPLSLQSLEVTGRAVLHQGVEKGLYELGAAEILILFRAGAQAPVPEQLTASRGAYFVFSGTDGVRMRCESDILKTRFDTAGRFPARSEGQGQCRWNYQRPARQERVEASGQRFWIEFFPQTADPFRFRLDGDVKARRTVAERWSETSSDTLTGEFSPSDHRQLSGLVQQGDVRFRDAERQGRAREARLEGDLLHLTGKPVVESAGVVTRAAEMTYNQRTSALQGAGGVETVIVPGSAPGQKAVLPMGDAESAGQKVYIHADTVELDQTTNQVTFRGGCRMVQARNVLTAGRFVWNRQDETFSAEDKVLLVATVREKTGPERRLEIRSGRLAYNPLRRRILFEREVRTLSADGEMASDALWGYFEEGQGLRKLFAQGQIRITQKSREATGDRAMVDLAQNRFVLQGSPARVVDRAEGRTTQGVQLTFFQGDDTIRVDSKAQPIDME